MRLKNTYALNRFIEAVDKCKGDVLLKSQCGDEFNLKSTISQYIALGALLREEGENLELFCSNKEDEAFFLDFFQEFPETLSVSE